MRRAQWLTDETDLAVNREILAALLRSDIEVKGDYNPKIFHQKVILRDYDGKATATSALLSGSANFTWTETHSNLNNVFIFRNAYICRQYLTEWSNSSGAASAAGSTERGPRPTTWPGCRCGYCSPPTTPRSWRS